MPDATLSFELASLPVPPSLNNMYANKRGGGRRISERYASWKADASTRVMAARRPRGPMAERAEIEIRIHPVRRGNVRDDITNRIKPLEDLLVNAGILADDSIVAKCTIERDPSLPPGTCDVRAVGR